MFHDPSGHNARPIDLPSACVHRRPGHPKGEPCGQHRRQCGAGVGCGHRLSFPDGGAGPFSARILRGRGRGSAPARFAHLIARARQRAHLSCRLLTGFQKWRRPAAQHRESGSGVRFPRGHCSTIRQMSSPNPDIFHEMRTNFRRHPASGPLLTAPGPAPCPRRPPVRRSGLRRSAARPSSGRDIA